MISIRTMAFFLLAALFASALGAQSAFLVSDLAPDPTNGDGQDMHFDRAAFQGELFFRAYDPLHGEEPWVSDGTTVGTRRLVDACPGACSSSPTDFTVAGGRLYFTADDGVAGRELWTSDGTAAGTRLFAEAQPGRAGTPPELSHLAAVGDELFYTAGDGWLWKSDGTSAGTRRVRALCRVCGNPVALLGSADRLFFLVQPPRFRALPELWTSDGTRDGTRRLIESCDDCRFFGVENGLLFFEQLSAAGAGIKDRRLWVSDGTDDGTHPLETRAPCDGILRHVVPGNGEILFVVQRQDPIPSGSSNMLCRTDGTDLMDEPLGEIRDASLATKTEDAFFFSRFPPRGRQSVWSLRFGETEPFFVRGGFTTVRNLQSDGRRVYIVDGGSAVDELWVTDGTPRGTQRLGVFDLSDAGAHYPVIRGLETTATHAFFQAWDAERGWELWASDGTEAGTFALADLGRDPGSSRPRALTALGERLIFTAEPESPGAAFASDGDPDDTLVLLAPIQAGAFFPVSNALVGDVLVFSVDYPLYNIQQAGLFRTDGTPEGTELLVDDLVLMGDAVEVDGTLFFNAFRDREGAELWRSDGTSAGTVLVKDVNPGFPPVQITPCCGNDSNPHELTAFGSKILFAAADSTYGNVELWASDGSEDGTAKVFDICPDPEPSSQDDPPCSSNPSGLTAFESHVYFAADSMPPPSSPRGDTGGNKGRELWRTDGTAEGTALFADLNPGRRSSAPHDFFVLEGTLYFFARRGNSERLWAIDDPDEAPRRVHQLIYRRQPSWVSDHQVVDGRVFFVVQNANSGAELWTSDGTTRGTRLVVDLREGPLGSYPGALTALDDRLLFAADDGISGRELWMSDGTKNGTVQLLDLAPGPDSSNPDNFLLIQRSIQISITAPKWLFFAADTAETGRELWGFTPVP